MKDSINLNVLRVAAFSDGATGGNPAGVVLGDTLPSDFEMQRLAQEVGYSETVFAAPQGDAWRVRYFSPEEEVAFCGHATIALGNALTAREGGGLFQLDLNSGRISVETKNDGSATLTSPPTHSAEADPDLVAAALALFGLKTADLDPALPPAQANAGNNHLILALRDRQRLAAMSYDLAEGAQLMRAHDLTTISLLWAETPRRFHSRNAFAIGGVAEDPATGAAAAALSGYLRDIGWPHEGEIDIVQGEDMGARSLLKAQFGATPGEGIRVSGTTRIIEPDTPKADGQATSPVTVLAPIKLAEGKTEADLLAASAVFQRDFVAHEPGILRRELVRKPDGTYLDIVQFRSHEDYQDVVKKEMESPVCAMFFSVMDLSDFDPDAEMDVYISLETH
ncbi:PhzF family phenazine biosynthesis protein [Shimia sp. R9_1]|uniref:PhzF family phenazine biosynthesis protein n=1 Tax=Shimia sp. R9_1 TaxID=2821111 RepID=UPI001ADADE68|nr:PhzF family phenazine biosynthesis protein [Shimia sp. R9_1]MBO9407860.1 PhzF family phenazine biosynthesis protein [Shimia sp. R9_1]